MQGFVRDECGAVSKIADGPAATYSMSISGRPLAPPDVDVTDDASTLILSTRQMLTEPGALLVVVPEQVLSALATEFARRCEALLKEENRLARISFYPHDHQQELRAAVLPLSISPGSAGREMLQKVKDIMQQQGREDAVKFIDALVKRG